MKVRIFTDGACCGNPGPGGWAAVILFSTDKQELSGYEDNTTNNRMELKAIVEGLKLALVLGFKNIEVNSDSAYCVNAVNFKWVDKWQNNGWKTIGGGEVKNKDLWIQLVAILKKNKKIAFIKVKGHADNVYNNLADKLAVKEARKAKNAIIGG